MEINIELEIETYMKLYERYTVIFSRSKEIPSFRTNSLLTEVVILVKKLKFPSFALLYLQRKIHLIAFGKDTIYRIKISLLSIR